MVADQSSSSGQELLCLRSFHRIGSTWIFDHSCFASTVSWTALHCTVRSARIVVLPEYFSLDVVGRHHKCTYVVEHNNAHTHLQRRPADFNLGYHLSKFEILGFGANSRSSSSEQTAQEYFFQCHHAQATTITTDILSHEDKDTNVDQFVLLHSIIILYLWYCCILQLRQKAAKLNPTSPNTLISASHVGRTKPTHFHPKT